MSRSVSTRSETKTINGKTQTTTVTEEVITHPDGSVEKNVTTKTTEGGGSGGQSQAPRAFDDEWFKSKPRMRPFESMRGRFEDDGSCVEAKPQRADAYPELRPKDFHREALKKHNAYRAKHGEQPLELCPQLCAYAQEWADQLAKSSNFQHRPDVSYGENIFYGMNSQGMNPLESVDKWYAEVANYNYAKPCFAPNTGHFSQVVWAASRKLGIAFAQPRPDTVYVVANYDPPGNVQGRFPENVHKAL